MLDLKKIFIPNTSLTNFKLKKSMKLKFIFKDKNKLYLVFIYY